MYFLFRLFLKLAILLEVRIILGNLFNFFRELAQHNKKHCPRMWCEFYFVQEGFHQHVKEGACYN